MRKTDIQKILLTNHHLVQPGGSETWTLTVATELVRRGHDVTVFAHDIGPFAETLPCDVTSQVKETFDLGLVNHRSCIDAARESCRHVIMTCHGTFPALEQPVIGANRYVAVSGEVLAHLARLGYCATVINNPIDCRVFSPKRPVNGKLHRVLSLCQGVRANRLLGVLCEREGWDLRTVEDERRAMGVERLMNEADLIVGLGRSAMEGMACGRPVLVLDSRSYTPYAMDGIITPENATTLLECNFSGRRLKLDVTLDSAAAQLAHYDPLLGDFGRQFVVANLEVGQQVDSYLDLAASIDE